MNDPAPIAEWRAVDRGVFERDIVPRYEPAVLRGQVADWPAVRRGAESDAALCAWLGSMDSGSEVDALMVPPRHHGRIFYGEGWQGFNYLRNRLPVSQVIEQVLRYSKFPDPPAVAIQSALADDCVPGFTAAHAMPLVDAAVAPRLWLGNAIVTPTHFDETSNIACVAAGERRFTLFPPEQIANLYIGPIGHAPTGTPISLVDPDAPDLALFPRFESAMKVARSALLGPGDAIYIPPLWWHHVASRKPVNLLVNYWWSSAAVPSGLDALLHARWAFGAFPAAQRRAWQALLAHWVFEADETTMAHVPPAWHGLHGELTPALCEQIRALLCDKFQR
jgi:Cupin-like domain